jgi:diguanylate cyclase (GGDEF)-like protein
MVDFFSNQLDYVFFVYGLAFLFLGVVCFALRHPSQKFLPWNYVGLFGLAHGLNEWADLVAFSVGDNLFFRGIRLILLTASFALLVEFGRISYARLGRRSPGQWIYLPVAALLLLGALLGGAAGFNDAVRYTLGLIGTLWTAGAFLLRARAVSSGAAPRLRIAAAFMVLYGVAAALVVPASPLPLAAWLNQESFFAATGLPIQVFRTLFACGLAAAVWAYEQQRFENSPLREKRKSYFQVSALALAVTLLTGWVITERLGVLYRTELQRQVKAELSLLAERLAGTTAVTRGLARTMSGSPFLTGAVPAPSARIDSVIDRYGRASEDLVAFIMDLRGNVIAASNRQTTASLLGHNYGDRRYFQEALQGREAGDFAMGRTTGLPGFYASAPIRDARGNVTGVAVIKKGLSSSELGLHHFENGFLVDQNGIVLLGGKPGGPIRLWPSPDDRASLAGGGTTLAPQPFGDGERLRLRDGIWLVGANQITPHGWSIVVLQRETISLVSRLFGIAITLLMSAVILLASFGMQREIGTEIQLHQKQERLQELSQRMERLAVTDALTGAFNRLKFDEVLASEMQRAARYATPLALIMYDIDLFKRINDRYGHQAGDRVLVELTQLISANTRVSDLVARWGGEEFMIIVPQTALAEAAALAEKLRQRVAVAPLGPEPITCSFGVVERRERDTLETLTARADRALYQAKTAGRNRVETA